MRPTLLRSNRFGITLSLTVLALVGMLFINQLRADAAGVTVPDEELTLVANLVVTQDDTVVEMVHVLGDIEIQADNVTIRQVRVTSEDSIPVRVDRNAVGLVVEDTTITCGADVGRYGIGHENFTANRVELVNCAHGFGDGLNVTVTDSMVDGVPVGVTEGPVGGAEDPAPTTTEPPAPTTTEAPAPVFDGELQWSVSRDRTDPSALDGASVPDKIRIFLTTDVADIDHVAWYLDGALVRDDDLAAPWDLAPGAGGRSGPVDVAALDGSEHLATAVVHLVDGTEETVNARFSLEQVAVGGADESPTTTAPPVTEPPAPAEPSYPSADTTGVQDGVALTPSGSITVREDGAVIEGLDVTGTITVRADDVTIRNVRVSSSASHLIRNHGDNLLIEDVTLVGQQPCSAGVGFTNYTARRVDVSGCADGLKANGNVLVEDSYIHDLRKWAGTHNDGIQSTGGSNIVVRNNTIQGAFRDSVSGVKFTSEFNHLSNVTIEGNLFSGGNYTIYLTKKPGMRAPTDIRIADNVFVEGTAKWGWLYNDNDPSQVFENNVWDDGTPVG
ncbi:MAG: right-handed parallel beta-helix repeat-containing protein [Actinomycetota bacterium]